MKHISHAGLYGLVLILMTASCAVGPNFKAPPSIAPQQFRGAPPATQTNSLADLPWWRVFNDPALTNLIAVALTNNYDARIAVTRIEQSRALEIQARSPFFPQLGYDVNAYKGKNAFAGGANPGGGGATLSSFEAALNASWEIDLWGRIRRLNEAAKAQFLATQEARHAVQVSLLAGVAQSYFQLLELDEELAIARRATNSYGETLDIFNARLGGGVASKLESDRAAGALAAAAAVVPDLERRIGIQENQIQLLLGRAPGPLPRSAKLLDQTTPPEVPAGLPSSLMERRPDIRESGDNLRLLNAEVGVAMGDFFPRIGLTALFGTTSEQLNHLTDPVSHLWSLGADVSGPLFQAGKLYGAYHLEKAAWEEAKLQYQQTVLNAFAEVADALIAREKLAAVRSEQATAVAAYSDAVDIAIQRYRAGRANYTEVLDAQQQLFPEEVQLAQTEYNQLLSIVQLYTALGGGWATSQ